MTLDRQTGLISLVETYPSVPCPTLEVFQIDPTDLTVKMALPIQASAITTGTAYDVALRVTHRLSPSPRR